MLSVAGQFEIHVTSCTSNRISSKRNNDHARSEIISVWYYGLSLGAFWRGLAGYRQPPGELVIDLNSDDEMDLGTALLCADPKLKESLGLEGQNCLRVYNALTYYAANEHLKGRIVDGMVPVRLTEQDWKAVFAFCVIAKDQVEAKWPIRVIRRITAETAKVYPKVGGKREG